MSVALISYTTRPGEGSEGGVGWAFVHAAISASRGTSSLHIIIDERDLIAVRNAIALEEGASHVHIHAVPLPTLIKRRVGARRTRASYLAWRRRAATVIAQLHSEDPLSAAHQVTFASAVLPPVRLPRGVRAVWGPVSVPSRPSRLSVSRAAASMARVIARINVRHDAVVLATNDEAARVLGRVYATEPNIVVEPQASSEVSGGGRKAAIVGLLTARKRPWLALEAIAHPSMRGCNLLVIGDGPLRASLEALAESLGVADRVEFTGVLSRADAIRALSGADVLIHPSAREGACWVVGEAAAVGVPAVVFAGTGAETAVVLSDNGGRVVDSVPADAAALAEAAADVLRLNAPARPSSRWSAERLPLLLTQWWGLRE